MPRPNGANAKTTPTTPRKRITKPTMGENEIAARNLVNDYEKAGVLTTPGQRMSAAALISAGKALDLALLTGKGYDVRVAVQSIRELTNDLTPAIDPNANDPVTRLIASMNEAPTA
jgi:hypothetical protein